MQAQSLGLEDALEEEMSTHSSMFTWEIRWTEESGGEGVVAGGANVHVVSKELDNTWRLNNNLLEDLSSSPGIEPRQQQWQAGSVVAAYGNFHLKISRQKINK